MLVPLRTGHTVFTLERTEMDGPPEGEYRTVLPGPDGRFACQCGIKVHGPWTEVMAIARYHTTDFQGAL
jgi:hypothetical protein